MVTDKDFTKMGTLKEDYLNIINLHEDAVKADLCGCGHDKMAHDSQYGCGEDSCECEKSWRFRSNKKDDISFEESKLKVFESFFDSLLETKPTLTEAPKTSFKDGDKVKLVPPYTTPGDETFTVSQCEPDKERCWIGDKGGRGWYADFSQLKSARSKKAK